MFQGVVPRECIQQITEIFAFRDWNEIFIGCSGTFRLERALLGRHKDLVIRSNDVSLFSTALGRLFCGETLRIRFHSRLAFVEEHLAEDDFFGRVAAVLVAVDAAQFGVGRDNVFKRRHLAHVEAHFGEALDRAREKLTKLKENTPITSYSACDWREHVSTAISKGAGVVAFPPFAKGGYERMFRFLAENVEWPEPSYPLYDPKDLYGILKEVDASGVPYCILSDQVFDDPQPVLEYRQGVRVPHYCYGRAVRTSLRHLTMATTPFAYRRIDLDRITERSKLTIVPAESRRANYIREVYLSHRIAAAVSGTWNFFVHIDDMLVGVLVYSPEKFPTPGEKALYLLSDVCTTREARLSKLVARAALNSGILDHIGTLTLNRYDRVYTTAFSEHPASMKYRGLLELVKRQPVSEPSPGFMLNYSGQPLAESLDDCFSWWWTKHGRKALANARNRAPAA